MAKGITLNKKFGINPSVLHCECCGKDYAVGMFGTSWKDPKTGKTAEAPKDVYHGFCDDCQKVIDAKGLLIVEIKDGETSENPYRTGRLVGISKDAKVRMFKDIDSPMCYMEETMFSQMFGDYCTAP